MLLKASAKWLLIFAVICCHRTEACNRKPQGANGDRSAVDENFQILIDGNPSSYIPGQQYNVSISCADNLKFHSFTLTVQRDPNDSRGSYDTLGEFEIIDATETRFSTRCENTVESTNTNVKSRSYVSWIAPKDEKSGCVLIKAAVLQDRNVWFMDDGFLTKRLCPEEIDEVNSQTPAINPCCACDEAKYELVMERRWSRNTHPKHFPKDAKRTRLSEIIGASHTYEYRFWEYGTRASPGLQLMAEHGSSQELESEITQNIENDDIRTIIKAPAIIYRENAQGTTMATVRVDPRHHLISLVSKVTPSPDWILGVAGLELCLANCTWVEFKQLNLFPWDIGTDAGPSYMSPDEPQLPPDVVRRITSFFPSDSRSPFYDETGRALAPLATLYIKRKKLYERECDTELNVRRECLTHPWMEWSECSTKCGSGIQFRERVYKNPDLAERSFCETVLNETQQCIGKRCSIDANQEDENEDESELNVPGLCVLGDWSPWSECSVSCGKGLQKRTRAFKGAHTSHCQLPNRKDSYEQVQDCYASVQCGGPINEDNEFSWQRNSDFTGREPNEWNGGKENDENNEENNVWGNNYGQQPQSNPDLDFPSYSNEIADVRDKQKPFNYHKYGKGNKGGYPDNYRYSGSKFQSNTERSMYDNGIHEQHDENGQAIVVEGTDTNEYSVLQEYCLEKPFSSRRKCSGSVEISNYWFFDNDDRECKLFTTDNCDENKNKFRSLEACEGTCLRPQQNLEAQQQQSQNEDNQNAWSDDFGEPRSQTRPRMSNRRFPERFNKPQRNPNNRPDLETGTYTNSNNRRWDQRNVYQS